MITQSTEPTPKRETGKIKWFSFERGYGFITSDESGKDVFVHRTGISEEIYHSIKESDRVEYTIAEGRKGLEAVEVILLTDE